MVIVGASQGNSLASQTTLPLTRTAGAIGNLIIMGMQVANGAAAPTISDTQTNTWLPMPTFNDATNVNTLKGWFAYAKNTSSMVITVASNVAAAFMSMTLDEFTDAQITLWTLDQTAHSATGQTTANPISQAFTPTNNGELIWAYSADSITAVGNIDGGAATKGGDDGNQDWSEWRLLVGRAGISMTAAFVGTAGAYDVIVATFQPPSGSVGYAASSRPFSFKPGRR